MSKDGIHNDNGQLELIMINLLKRFKNDESGATAIEYGLIAALIAVAIIAGAGAVGGSLDEKFNLISDEIAGAGATPAPAAP